MTAKLLFIAALLLSSATAEAAAPTIDSLNIQSYIRLMNGMPVTATSANLVFAVFKGSSCIWAKRYLAVSLNAGMINQRISGLGSSITSINNVSATAGECVANFSATSLNATLLMSGATAQLTVRIYSETNLDGYNPIWDVAIATAPTAFVADTAINATNATTANDLITSKKVLNSTGASDSGKFPYLDSAGKLDNSVINNSALSITNTQITGLGTAAVLNTGTTAGTIPLLNGSAKLTTGMMPTYATNRIMTSDGSGNLSATLTGVNTSAGAGDAGKVALLNASGRLSSNMLQLPTYTANRILSTDGSGNTIATLSAVSTSLGVADAGKITLLDPSGKIDDTLIDSSTLTPNLANATGTLSVAKGGTGLTTLTSGALITGNGTSGVQLISPTNGEILIGAGGAWTSSNRDAAGLVDKTSDQTIGGNKTWSGNQVITGTVSMGNGGSTFSKIIHCSIPSTLQSSEVDESGACADVTPSTVVSCSPTTTPASGWVVGSSRGGNDAVVVRPVRHSGADTWTTGYNCIAYVQ
jgi:hypothetical protein